MQDTIVTKIVDTVPKVDTPTLNFDYLFTWVVDIINWIFSIVKPIIDFLIDPKTWSTLGSISVIASFVFLIIIIFSIVRLLEIQIDEKKELKHKIKETLEKDREKLSKENPKWSLILKMVESPNESDWRMAILEADAFMEDSLKEKGLAGNTVSELLEDARSNGYLSIQGAWDSHILRNKIAHEGTDFPVTQVEARRAIRLYQDFFEELKII
jgi:hypothetical protein